MLNGMMEFGLRNRGLTVFTQVAGQVVDEAGVLVGAGGANHREKEVAGVLPGREVGEEARAEISVADGVVEHEVLVRDRPLFGEARDRLGRGARLRRDRDRIGARDPDPQSTSRPGRK